jgi:hypothetical protein
LVKYKKDMELPFKEQKIEENIYIREFSQDTDSSDFLWHRDREDRIIEPLEETDWLFQLDDELPKKIEDQIFIPKEIFHRIIKGRGDLKIKLIKL